MTTEFQTLAALALVALAATWLVRRAFAKKQNPDCGSDCGCASKKFPQRPGALTQPEAAREPTKRRHHNPVG